MYSEKQEILKELETLAAENGGLVNPEKWVEFAKNPATHSHAIFEWDDSVAGHQWRVAQARSYLRVIVTVIPETNETFRTYVSLSTERNPEGGYRPIAAVLKHKDWSAQLLSDALAEMKAFEAKYLAVKELSGVFAAMKAVKKPKK